MELISKLLEEEHFLNPIPFWDRCGLSKFSHKFSAYKHVYLHAQRTGLNLQIY